MSEIAWQNNRIAFRIHKISRKLKNCNIPLAKAIDAEPMETRLGPGTPDLDLARFHNKLSYRVVIKDQKGTPAGHLLRCFLLACRLRSEERFYV